MAKYIIVNHGATKDCGKVRHNTTYFTGVLNAGGFKFQNWDRGKKNAYVFETKVEANRYFKNHKLGLHNEAGWVKIGYDCFTKSNYEIITID